MRRLSATNVVAWAFFASNGVGAVLLGTSPRSSADAGDRRLLHGADDRSYGLEELKFNLSGGSGVRGRQPTAAQPTHAQSEEDTFVNSTMGELSDDYNRLQRKLRTLAHVPRRTTASINKSFYEFLPGFRFQYNTFLSCAITVSFGLTWFLIYYNFVYENDRLESLDRWKEQLALLKDQEQSFNPDIIVVMHHPKFDYEDDTEDVSIDDLNRVLLAKPEAEKAFPELAEAKEKAGVGGFEAGVRRVARNVRQVARASGGMQREETAGPPLVKKEARRCLLKDMFAFLRRQGFSVTAFSSIDGDELFLCVTLRRRKAICHYLARDHRGLQLRSEVVSRLVDEDKSVLQDSSDPACSPPILPYEPAILKTLAPDHPPAERETVVFNSYRHAGKELCLCTRESVQIITQEISGYMNLDAAVELEMAVVWYPVHNKLDTARLAVTWANWRALKDLTFVQPISFLREYFGSRLAFMFAWNGLHCKSLVVLTMISGLWLLACQFVKHVLGSDFISDRQVIGFSIVLCVWSKITNNMWKREETFFLQLWGMLGASLEPGFIRPSFYGELVPSPLNANIMERQYPRRKAILRRFVTAGVTFLFCAFVCTVIWTWMLMFQGNMGRVSAMILALMVKVFQFIFQYLVQLLVDFENHKFPEDWFNSYLWKLFLFEYVNNYSAFFFLTISNAGPDDSCAPTNQGECSARTLLVLRSQVSTTLLVLAVCSVAQVIAHIFIIKIKFTYEDYQYRRKFHEEPPERSFHEEQAKRAKIDEAAEVQNMMTLVIALGFVLHFGGVAPLALVFTFAVFAVQLRAFAVLLVGSAQRAVPQRSQGIGSWSVIVEFLMTSGVLYTGFLFVAYGMTLEGAPLLAKTTCFAIFCFSIFLAWAIVEMTFPAVDEEEDLLFKRRNYVKKLIMEMSHKGELTEHDESDTDIGDDTIAASISSDKWDQISGRTKTPRWEDSLQAP